MKKIDEEKLKNLIKIYLDYISQVTLRYHVEEEEGYKFEAVNNFQKNFNLNEDNISVMLDKAILSNNLAQGAMYFPKRMLLSYAELFPNETRNILKNLFDESKDVGTRINETEKSFFDLNEQRNKDGENSGNSYITLRFISLLLGYKFPEKYNPLKPSEWKFICSYLDDDFAIPNGTSSGEKYSYYEPYIEAIRKFIKNNDQIIVVKNALTKGLEFSDSEFRWMTQDVIYITAKIISGKKSKPDVEKNISKEEKEIFVQLEEDTEENTGFMPLEKHLEEYILKNWETVDFGERLEIFLDEDGAPAQQYVTEEGIIDILAKDERGSFVVIELKRADENYKVVGQILNYMGWVRKNLATRGEGVRGLIIVGRADNTLKNALSEVSDKVALREYKIKLKLEKVKI